MTPVDAKRNGYPVFVAPKHAIEENTATIDLIGNSPALVPEKKAEAPPITTFRESGIKLPTASKAVGEARQDFKRQTSSSPEKAGEEAAGIDFEGSPGCAIRPDA